MCSTSLLDQSQSCPLGGEVFTFGTQSCALVITLPMFYLPELIIFCSYTDLCQDGHENKDFSCVFRHFYPGKDEI